MSGATGLKSRPYEALHRVVDTPNWVANLLWLALAAIASNFFVGHIALLGYGSELIKYRIGLPGAPRHDVDSERLGDYLSQGIWPFIVQFVVQIAVSVVTTIPIMMILFIGIGAGVASFGEEGAAIGMIGTMPLIMVVSVFMMVFLVPFAIRAMIVQDFKESFDFGWCWNFTKIMWWEIAISALVFYLLCIPLMFVGLLCCFVGVYVSAGIAMGGAMNLLSQWYEIYLDRGGEPVRPIEEVVEASLV